MEYDGIESLWSGIQNAMYTDGMKSCGTAQSMQLLNARRSVPVGTAARQQLNAELTHSLRRDREQWWINYASQLESAFALGDFHTLFKLIRSSSNTRITVRETICELDGTTIHKLQRHLERWAEHFASQFNRPVSSVPRRTEETCTPWDVLMEPSNETEVLRELQHLKRYTAHGSNKLQPASFEDGGSALVSEMTLLFAKIWFEVRVSSAYTEAVIAPIFEKGQRNACGNYRGISLLAIAFQLLASILFHRLANKRNEEVREEQAGFRAGQVASTTFSSSGNYWSTAIRSADQPL